MSVPSIAVVEGCAVEDLVATADGRQVIGVRVSRRHPGPTEEIVLADLVVDCSGRGSRAPVWLEALGYPKPDVELVDVGMGYSTRFYQREPEHLLGDMIVNVAPSPENRRACGMMAQEGDRWIVTLAGYFGDHPPTDEKGFLAFAGALAAPEVHDIIRVATPLSDPVSYRFRANQWRHYERLARFPAGFLVFGDAICSFTPIYGQGMTVAALEALALRECLEAGTERLSRRFFKRASKVVSVAWNISAGNDMRLSEAGAGRAPMTRLLHWYMSRLLIAARRDASVAMAFLQVASFLAAPPALLRPAIAARVLWGNLTATRRQQPEAGSPEPASLPSQP